MSNSPKTTFVPMLWVQNGITDIDFYKLAFNAIEIRRINNDDGTVHVAELTIDGALFQIHEETIYNSGTSSPLKNNVTTTIGLMVPDIDTVMAQAISAGAIEISPAISYDYGYRQGEIKDPFGHLWLIQQMV